MELKELMEKKNLSERKIIEAIRITGLICRNFNCSECPLDSDSGCMALETREEELEIINENVTERIQELLHPNRMEKVAEVLGVRLGWITVTNTLGETSRYHLTKNGLYNDRGIAVPGLLTGLLIGKAYIVKEDKDE